MSAHTQGDVARGSTFYGPNATIDTDNYGTSVDMEGLKQSFPDTIAPSAGNKERIRSGDRCLAILVRNTSGSTLLPGQAVSWASGYRGRRVDGLVRTTAAPVAGIVDDHLAAAGVRNGDMFWLIVGGPCLCKTSLAGNAENVISQEGALVALTAATSGATTAGRVVAQSLTASSQLTDYSSVINQANNLIGHAMSAKTTGNTNADVLVYLQLVKQSN